MESDYWMKFREVRASRRRLLGAGAAAGAGVAGLALVGCGGGSEKPDATVPPAASAAGSASASASPVAKVNRGGTLRGPLVGTNSANPPTLYPFENFSYLAQIPATIYYSRLLRGVADSGADEQAKLEGDLAAKWEQPDAAGLTYVFTFKPNVKWQDKAPLNGRAATAQDWANTYQAFLKKSQNAPVWSSVVDKVEATDEKTLKITLKTPFGPFAVTHASSAEGCWFIPTETIDNDQVKTSPVGTGPFIFDKFDSGVAITGHKNPTYYDAPLPNFDKVESSLLADPQRIVAALQSGDFDWSLLSGALYKESRPKLDAKGTDVFPADSNQTSFFFNFDNKPFNDARVRQALSMALDRDGYLKTQDGTGKGNWSSFLAPNLGASYLSPRDKATAYGASAKYFQYSPADSKALLKAATGSDTLNFKLYANVNAYGAIFQQRWEAFASTIKESGFNAELTYVDYATVYTQTIYLGKIPDGCAVGPLIAVARDPDDMFMRCYASKSARHNWGGTPIKEMADLDAMFDKQRTILNAQERVKYVQDIQVKMAESMLVVPTHAPAGWVYAGPVFQKFNYKAAYSNLVDAGMSNSFTDERLKKG